VPFRDGDWELLFRFTRPSHVKHSWLTRLLITPMALLIIGIIPTVAQAASSLNAGTVSANVAGFRQDTRGLLDSYYATYGSRLSPAEQTNMSGLIKHIDAELAVVQSKSQFIARLSRQQAPKPKQLAAARSAAKAFDAAYSHAITSLKQVQPLLQPKLSLFEALRAKSDLDSSLQEFETLGTQLHALAR